MRRPSPDVYSVSMPKAAKNDFYSVYLEIPELNYQFSCKDESEKGLEGVLWIDRIDGSPATLLKSSLRRRKWDIRIQHFYKGAAYEYNSGIRFILSTLTSKHRFIRSKNKIAQAVFNKKKLVRAERIELLQHIFNKTENDSNYSISPFSIGTELYSKRWVHHPEQNNLRNYYQLLLDSLLDSKDLKKDKNIYKLSSHALLTLSEYAREEQRHEDNQNSAKKTRSLTIAIIVLGSLNLMFHVGKWVLEYNDTNKEMNEIVVEDAKID